MTVSLEHPEGSETVKWTLRSEPCLALAGSVPWTPESTNALPVTVTFRMSVLKSETAFRTRTVTRKVPAMQRGKNQ